jgi:hypothetical protein
MSNLVARIQKLIDCRRAVGQPIDHHFLPGLSRDYLQEKISQYPFYFPEELIALYTWHNGTQDENFLIFRDMAWLSLDNAIHEYEQNLEYFWSIMDGYGILDNIEYRRMFPFAAFEGSCLYLSYPGQAMCPHVELPIIATGEGVLAPYFTSVESMLTTVEEWFSVGQHSDYGCEVEAELEREIWQKHNPEVYGLELLGA